MANLTYVVITDERGKVIGEGGGQCFQLFLLHHKLLTNTSRPLGIHQELRFQRIDVHQGVGGGVGMTAHALFGQFIPRGFVDSVVIEFQPHLFILVLDYNKLN